METKKWRAVAAPAAIVIVLLGIIVFILHGRGPQPYGKGLFCWDDSVFGDRASLFEKMGWFGVNELYQSFPGKVSWEEKEALLKEASKRRLKVYFLTGSPEWGLDAAGKEMKEEVLEAAAINEQAGENIRLRGVMMDTEPYLTDEWDEDREAVMRSYVTAMIEAYETAKQHNLEFIACIPYHYDSQGLEKELERLVEKGCDGIAVMNYNKKDECGQIETEAALAETYGKFILNIYELQKPGRHDITENNTYYAEGFPGVEESFQKMRNHFKYRKLGYAIHDYGALEELAVYE